MVDTMMDTMVCHTRGRFTSSIFAIAFACAHAAQRTPEWPREHPGRPELDGTLCHAAHAYRAPGSSVGSGRAMCIECTMHIIATMQTRHG